MGRGTERKIPKRRRGHLMQTTRKELQRGSKRGKTVDVDK